MLPEGYLTDLDLHEILEYVNEHLVKSEISISEIKELKENDLIDYIYDKVVEEYTKKIEELPVEIANEFEKAISLRVIDTHWMEHINTMSNLREGIHLRSYAQVDPLRAYTSEGFEMYDDMLSNIDKEITTYLINAEVRQNVERKQVVKGEAVNDANKVKKKSPKVVNKIGRNEPCPCGSGKKYKQCCGK